MTTEAVTINGKLLLTADELAEMLSISKATLHRWVERGDLPQRANTPGRVARWRAEEVDRALKRMQSV